MISRPESTLASPLERARALDAEMRLQRAWLELSLRDLSGSMRGSVFGKLRGLNLGLLGLSILKNRSLWLAGLSLLINVFRRRANREKRP